MSKGSRLRRSLIHRKYETLRQYIYRARDDGLWHDDVTREGLLVWLNTYESVRFGGVELTEGEFLDTMKLVYYLLIEMKPPENVGYVAGSVVSSSSSSSEFSLEDSDSMDSFSAVDTGLFSQSHSLRHTGTDGIDGSVLRHMDTIMSSPRKSVDTGRSVTSVIDHGSDLEQDIDREERDRRMRGGRLGEREGSVIYYDVD
jgi:hypothetical protein